MTKRFLYEFNGTAFVEDENEDEAEKLIIGIPLADYLVDEDLWVMDLLGKGAMVPKNWTV